MNPRLIQKLERLRQNLDCGDFVLADAKDADMAWGVPSPGLRHPVGDPAAADYVGMPAFRDQIRTIVEQGLVDIMLASTSTMSLLAHQERLFDTTDVTPAVRINDTSDVWAVRGGRYAEQPSRPFASSRIHEVQHGALAAEPGDAPVVNLGLYSATFNNDLDADHRTLTAFHAFREDAAARGFDYFLEVFAPNVAGAVDPAQTAGFVNDHICRMLAGVSLPGRPAFLKIPYLGPRALEELVSYDPTMIVGVLGGGSGTTHDAFALLQNARRHGARVALFGRKIKSAELPLAFVACLRRIADGELDAADAVKLYHDQLAQARVPARRSLSLDLELTENRAAYAGG